MWKRLWDGRELVLGSNRYCRKAGLMARLSCVLGFPIWAVRDSLEGEDSASRRGDEQAAR
jgi:hypothetical protein